jgi:hypothetical protein
LVQNCSDFCGGTSLVPSGTRLSWRDALVWITQPGALSCGATSTTMYCGVGKPTGASPSR